MGSSGSCKGKVTTTVDYGQPTLPVTCFAPWRRTALPENQRLEPGYADYWVVGQIEWRTVIDRRLPQVAPSKRLNLPLRPNAGRLGFDPVFRLLVAAISYEFCILGIGKGLTSDPKGW